jgi:hypothetical protein
MATDGTLCAVDGQQIAVFTQAIKLHLQAMSTCSRRVALESNNSVAADL